MNFISYAQNFEDVMLWRALQHVRNGIYVDIGAQHPLIDSVSKAFYEAGWRGVHVEPVPMYADLLRRDRPDDTVLQAALGAVDGTLELNVIDDTGLSTAIDEYAQSHLSERGFAHRRLRVPMLTMKSALGELAGTDVHWLKIDVEGFEEQVLRGWDSSALRPWIMVIEATIPSSRQTDYAGWDPILTAADYQCVYFDGLNRFYVAAEHPELVAAFAAPPNVFDGAQLSGLSSSSLCQALLARERALALQTERQAQWLRDEWVAASGRASALHEQLATADAQAQALQAALAAATAREQDLQAQLAAQAQGATALLEQRLAQLHTDVTACITRAEIAQDGWQDQQARMAMLQEGLDQAAGAEREARHTCADLQQQVHAMHASNAELNHWSHHWWTVASTLEQERQRVYASKSWRITAPLRTVVVGAKQAPGRVRRAPRWLRRRIATWGRPVLLTTIRMVLKQHRLAAFGRALLARHPGLKTRLRTFFTHAAFDASAQPAAPTSDSDSDSTAIMTVLNVSPRAARLYTDLQIAAARREH